MANVALLTLTLLIVKEIQPGAGGVTIVFESGRAGFLSAEAKDYDYFVRLARRSIGRKQPVAVSFADPQRIAELARADSDVVAIVDEQGPDHIAVSFQGHDGTYVLRRDHREAARIKLLLERSMRENKRLWFAARLPLLSLEDVLVFEDNARGK